MVRTSAFKGGRATVPVLTGTRNAVRRDTAWLSGVNGAWLVVATEAGALLWSISASSFGTAIVVAPDPGIQPKEPKMHLIRLDFVTFLKLEAAAGGVLRGRLGWRGRKAVKSTGIGALAMRLPGRARAPVAIHGGGSSGNLATARPRVLSRSCRRGARSGGRGGGVGNEPPSKSHL